MQRVGLQRHQLVELLAGQSAHRGHVAAGDDVELERPARGERHIGDRVRTGRDDTPPVGQLLGEQVATEA